MRNLLVVIFVSIFLTACGNSTETSSSKENNNEKVESTEKETNNQEEEVTQEETPEVKTVKKKQTITIADYCEFKIVKNEFNKKITPPNPASFYTYYENKEDGEIYLDTVISIKSLLTSGKGADEFANVKIVYDDKYEYDTFATIEDQGGQDFTYTNIVSIEPLKKGTLHFLASVPEEIKDDTKSLKAIITINGEEFEQKIR